MPYGIRKLPNKSCNSGKSLYRVFNKKTRKILDGQTISWNFFRCEECQLKNEFNDFLENYIIGGNLFESVNLKKGDALFFKDEEILHGRNSFIGNRWLIKGGLYV